MEPQIVSICKKESMELPLSLFYQHRNIPKAVSKWQQLLMVDPEYHSVAQLIEMRGSQLSTIVLLGSWLLLYYRHCANMLAGYWAFFLYILENNFLLYTLYGFESEEAQMKSKTAITIYESTIRSISSSFAPAGRHHHFAKYTRRKWVTNLLSSNRRHGTWVQFEDFDFRLHQQQQLLPLNMILLIWSKTRVFHFSLNCWH